MSIHLRTTARIYSYVGKREVFLTISVESQTLHMLYLVEFVFTENCIRHACEFCYVVPVFDGFPHCISEEVCCVVIQELQFESLAEFRRKNHESAGKAFDEREIEDVAHVFPDLRRGVAERVALNS